MMALSVYDSFTRNKCEHSAVSRTLKEGRPFASVAFSKMDIVIHPINERGFEASSKAEENLLLVLLLVFFVFSPLAPISVTF